MQLLCIYVCFNFGLGGRWERGVVSCEKGEKRKIERLQRQSKKSNWGGIDIAVLSVLVVIAYCCWDRIECGRSSWS